MRNFLNNHKILKAFLKIAIWLLVLAVVVWLAWFMLYSYGYVSQAPTLNLKSLQTNDAGTVEVVATTVPPTTTAAPIRILAPTEAPSDSGSQGQPVVLPELLPLSDPEETSSPDEQPAETEAPVTHAVYKYEKTIKVEVDGKEVDFFTFSYSGGYASWDDPWFTTGKKETKESYGPPIYGKTPQELTYNWLRELCKSPHQIIRLRTQMGIIKPTSLKEENKLAAKLAAKSAKNYDKVVNDTLKAFFTKLEGGRIVCTTDWDLENYMVAVDNSNGKQEINLHGRLNHDDDTKPEEKDKLLTFYAKGASKSFISSRRGFLNTLKDTKAKEKNFDRTAYVNMAEGGTWKHKAKGSGNGGNPPDGPTPTPAPTSTPKPTGRPTKNPKDRPTPPIGGGGTNPENSTDPQTKDHLESTPTPKAEKTKKPKVTATPEPAPTAVVRPTEACPSAAPLIREDTKEAPSGGDHNVPTGETQGQGDDSFDPNNI